LVGGEGNDVLIAALQPDIRDGGPGSDACNPQPWPSKC
jgi:hypothetical protein